MYNKTPAACYNLEIGTLNQTGFHVLYNTDIDHYRLHFYQTTSDHVFEIQ